MRRNPVTARQSRRGGRKIGRRSGCRILWRVSRGVCYGWVFFLLSDIHTNNSYGVSKSTACVVYQHEHTSIPPEISCIRRHSHTVCLVLLIPLEAVRKSAVYSRIISTDSGRLGSMMGIHWRRGLLCGFLYFVWSCDFSRVEWSLGFFLCNLAASLMSRPCIVCSFHSRLRCSFVHKISHICIYLEGAYSRRFLFCPESWRTFRPTWDTSLVASSGTVCWPAHMINCNVGPDVSGHRGYFRLDSRRETKKNMILV